MANIFNFLVIVVSPTIAQLSFYGMKAAIGYAFVNSVALYQQIIIYKEGCSFIWPMGYSWLSPALKCQYGHLARTGVT
jgi:hypothetical protein